MCVKFSLYMEHNSKSQKKAANFNPVQSGQDENKIRTYFCKYLPTVV